MPGIFYEFKLSVLQLPEEGLLIKIMNYSMFRKTIEEEKLKSRKKIKTFIESEFKTVLDTKIYNTAFKDYKALKKHTDKFEKKYGTDIYCRIGKEFFKDVLKNNFKMKHFRVLSAVSGILGKTDSFKPIGKERLIYAMYGFKSPDIEKLCDLAVWMCKGETTLKTLINKLHSYGFFSGAYLSKWSVYSTRLSQNDLEIIASDWLQNRHKKILSSKTNKSFAKLVDEKYSTVDKQILGKTHKYIHYYPLPHTKDSAI